MLQIHYYNGPQEEESLLSLFDPHEHLLIGSDLRTKKTLQTLSMKRLGWLPGESLQRAREFWQGLYRNLAPAEAPMGRELGAVYWEAFLKARPDLQEKWSHTEGLEEQVLGHIGPLMPLLIHESSTAICQELQDQQLLPGDKQEALELCREFFLYLRSHQRYLTSWCPYFLTQRDHWWQQVSKPCFFHLHADLGLHEAELIGTLSRYVEVTVLAPEPARQDQYPRLFAGYKALAAYTHKEQPAKESPASCTLEVHRYSSTLAECKDVVHRVRKALDGGAQPGEILILAPQIEEYWHKLYVLMEAEGVPLNKARVERLHGFYDIQVFLSRLRNGAQNFRREDLELEGYSREVPPLPYEKFQRAAPVLLEWSDLSRLGFQELTSSEGLEARLDRDGFLNWCLKFWPRSWSMERLEMLLKSYYEQVPSGFEFSLHQGVRFLETLASQLEVTAVVADPQGVVLDNLSSQLLSGFRHVFCLGLAQESFDVSQKFLLSPKETSELSWHFGMTLEAAHFQASDFALDWIQGHGGASVFFGFSESNMEGKVLSPSLPWLKNFRGAGNTLPGPTCWDARSSETVAPGGELHDFLLRDLGQRAAQPVQLNQQTFSPSGLEAYFSCPFMFLMSRGFRFADLPDMDMDITAMERGSLVHKIFEKMLLALDRSLTPPDFEAEVHSAQEETGYLPTEDGIWQMQKSVMVELARKFWCLEKERRSQNPQIQTRALELAVEGYYSPASGTFEKEAPSEEALKLRGFVDRVDQAAEWIALIDYKSSLSSIKQPTSWPGDGRLQLLLYALALEAGLSSLGPVQVAAAFYYGIRPLGELKGARLKEWPGASPRAMKEEDFEELKKTAAARIQSLTQDLIRGWFPPEPKDKKTCDSCKWRGVCRAPHLM